MKQRNYGFKYCATENLTSIFFDVIEKRIQVKQYVLFILQSLFFLL